MKKNTWWWLVIIVGFAAVMFIREISAPTAALEDIYDPELPTLVQFGTSTCPPCRRMMPELKELQDSYSHVFNIRYFDVHRNEDLARQFNVTAVPVQLFVAGDGEILARNEGYLSQEMILDRWQSLGLDAGNPSGGG